MNKFKRLLYKLFKIPLPLWTEEKLEYALRWTQSDNECRKRELKLFDNEAEARAYYMNLHVQKRYYEQMANAQWHSYQNNPFYGQYYQGQGLGGFSNIFGGL